MKKYPAIATLEFSDIAIGMQTTDALIKKAPLSLLKCGVISQGRYLTLIAGSPASVDESYREGLFRADAYLVDHMMLSDVDEALHDAIFGQRVPCRDGALGIIETLTCSCNLRATERMLKGTGVTLVEVRIADSLLHGKAVSIINGALHDVEAGVELAVDFLQQAEHPVVNRIITAPHEGLAAQISAGTTFGEGGPINLNGEIP
jgi:microcompartment protein CcmL/EutN